MLSPEFKLYLITEFQRLKKNETYQNKIEWNESRLLTKVNYFVHTDSIKQNDRLIRLNDISRKQMILLQK